MFLIGVILCSSFLVGCGASSSTAPADQTYVFKPFLALHVCLDNTLSYPVQFQHEALQNIADRIDSYITPNMGGMLVDVNLIEANSLQDTFVTFSVPAIPAIPPKPQAGGNDPYKFSLAMRDWKKTVAQVNSLAASVRANIKPYLDTLRAFHNQEVSGTDIPGCADTASGEFSHFPKGNKLLLYISDLQSNIDVNFSKHINLFGAKVRVIFMPCQLQSACSQLQAYYTQQFTAWNASSVEFFSPAESEAEKITF